MKKRLMHILSNIQHGELKLLPTWMVEPVADALIENGVTLPEVNFNTEFPTWIIAYCVDTNSWFCTNERFFYYEYPKDFECENDAIEYFRNNVYEFFKLSREMHPKNIVSIFLENTSEHWSIVASPSEAIKLKEIQ